MMWTITTVHSKDKDVKAYTVNIKFRNIAKVDHSMLSFRIAFHVLVLN